MNFDVYFQGLQRLSVVFKTICKENNCKEITLWFSALWCWIRYGVTPNQYIGFEFYKKNHLGRKAYYTLRHYRKYEKKLNDKKNSFIFCNKVTFLKTFSDWIRREWLYTSDSTEREISNFLNTHKKIIVKPIDAARGIGVHIYRGGGRVRY